MGWSRQQKVIKPEGDEGNRAAGREHRANETDRILSEKIEEPQPAPDRFAKRHLHECPSFSFIPEEKVSLQRASILSAERCCNYFNMARYAASSFTWSSVRLFKPACFGELAITFLMSSAVLPLIEGDFIAGLPAASAP